MINKYFNKILFKIIFNNNFEEQPTFVGMIPVKKEDGLAVGFMASSCYNPIVKNILNEYLNVSFNGLTGGNYYILLCRIAGEVLKQFMNVGELNEGLYEMNGQRILLIQEIWNEGDYNSCKGTYQGNVLFNSRYKDYPWDLRT